IEHLSAEDRALMGAVARCVFNGNEGRLRDQVERAVLPETPAPALFPPRKPHAGNTVLQPPENLQGFNGYGGHSAEGDEYVIWLPSGAATPAPWCNVLANEIFGSVVSEAGGAYTFAENAHEFRLTPWHNDPLTDSCGEAIWLRDEETGEFWSPTPAPTRSNDPYLIAHGFGYTRYEHAHSDLRSELSVFAARKQPVKLSLLKLRNAGARARRISVTGYVEWVLGEQRTHSAPHVRTRVGPLSGANRAGTRIDARAHVRSGMRALLAQHPFDIARDRNSSCARAGVAQFQQAQLHRLLARCEHAQFAAQIRMRVFVARVAEAMRDQVRIVAARRRWRRRPELAGFLVAQPNRFAARIGERIVVPRRQPELVRVFGERVGAAGFGNHAAENFIGQHVAPGRGCGGAGRKPDHIFVAFRRMPAVAVEALQVFRRLQNRVAGVRFARRKQRGRGRFRQDRALDLIAQAAFVAVEHAARDRAHQCAVFGGKMFDPPGVHATRSRAAARLGGGGDQIEDVFLQFLPITRALLVPDQQIGVQAARGPPAVRLDQLPHQVDLRGVGDARQHYRQVAGDAVFPQRRLSRQSRRRARVRAVRRVQQPRSDPFVKLRVARADVQLLHHHLLVRPCQFEHAVVQMRLAILVRQRQRVLARGGDAGDQVDADRAAGRNLHAASYRHAWVEHRAGAVFQRLSVERQRVCRIAQPAQEFLAIGFESGDAGRRTAHAHLVQQPGIFFLDGPRTPRCQQ